MTPPPGDKLARFGKLVYRYGTHPWLPKLAPNGQQREYLPSAHSPEKEGSHTTLWLSLPEGLVREHHRDLECDPNHRPEKPLPPAQAERPGHRLRLEGGTEPDHNTTL